MSLPQEKLYTIEDFHHMPEDIRAELINGRLVYMASPCTQHQRIVSRLHATIFNYISSEGGNCEVLPAPFSVQLREGDDTIVEPDISVICDPDKLNERGCLGAPDWIIEVVSPSNPSHDYITKLSLYYDAKVRLYWIVNPQSREIHVYNLDHGDFIATAYAFTDTIDVSIYQDFRIDFSKLCMDL